MGKKDEEKNDTPQQSDAVDRAETQKSEAVDNQTDVGADYNPEDVLQQVGDPTKGGVNRANATLPEGDVTIRDDAPLAHEIAMVPNPGPDVGEDEFAEKFNEDLARGFRGATPDPTPNEHYTIQGVTRGAPTPETHAGQRAVAREARTLDEGVNPL